MESVAELSDGEGVFILFESTEPAGSLLGLQIASEKAWRDISRELLVI